MSDSLAILPNNMGKKPLVGPGAEKKKVDQHKFIPVEKGGLLTKDPNEEVCPYTFSDAADYTRQKKAEEAAKRAAELEGKDETRGFLRSVEELGKKQKWEEAFQVLEKRTAVPSGLFLVTRAVLRWKFFRYAAALADTKEALKLYGSSAKAGPLAAALSSFLRICLGSEAHEKDSCSTEMRKLVVAWEEAEQQALRKHALGHGLFHPREEPRLQDPSVVVEGMEAHDGNYSAAIGVKIGYVLLKNCKDELAPVVVHFHGTSETAADYRSPALAEKYRDMPVHLFVIDYRGYGWSSEEPSLSTFLRDAEPFAEKLAELFVHHGFAWPYAGGVILSGRSLGGQVAVHLAAMFPTLFRALVLDSAVATSAVGDRLGRAPERGEALQCWRRELDKTCLDVLAPLASDFWPLSAVEKIRGYSGDLLVIHGLADDVVPYEASESLYAAAGTAARQKELVLIECAGHNNIGHHETYWSAQRRFALKVQLNDSLPSIGPVMHLCAVCAEKAESKCGRCQKVWYCGRKHQAEHWKAHKLTCAGGPSEPQPHKVEPEGEACLIAMVAVEISSEEDVIALVNSVESAGKQTESLRALYVGWHASSESLANHVTQALQDFEEQHRPLETHAVQAAAARSAFEHFQALLHALAGGDLAHAWIAFLEKGQIWSPGHNAALLPTLRRGAVDQRTLAARCSTHALPSASGAASAAGNDDDVTVGDATNAQVEPAAAVPGVVAAAPPLGNATEVDAALERGDAVLSLEGQTPELCDFVVKIKAFSALLNTTPSNAIAHEFCAYRFVHKLSHSFGKKVLTVTPSQGEWMRWSVTSPSPEMRAIRVLDVDRCRGQVLFEGAANTKAFANVEEATHALAELRRSVEHRMILWAGDKVSAKDTKTMAAECMSDFLAKVGLHTAIGLQKWARETSADISKDVAAEFSVTVTQEP